MTPETGSLLAAIPQGLLYVGELLFRWVPATVIAALGTVQGTTTPIATFTEPLPAWDVPTMLAQSSPPATYGALVQAWYTYVLIAIALSIPFIAVVLYCWLRIIQIRRAEHKEFEAAQRTVVAQNIPKTQLRWNRILEQAGAGTPENWRLAILEADIMLSELLDVRGYRGETVAEKMRNVDRADFHSIDVAWEAHKTRNRVAHEGAALQLSQREVRRVVSLYERVFKEFGIVG